MEFVSMMCGNVRWLCAYTAQKDCDDPEGRNPYPPAKRIDKGPLMTWRFWRLGPVSAGSRRCLAGCRCDSRGSDRGFEDLPVSQRGHKPEGILFVVRRLERHVDRLLDEP